MEHGQAAKYIAQIIGVCKELQITTLLIRSDNSTAVFDLRRLRAAETLAPAVKEIYLTCQHLNMKIITQHALGKINIIASNKNDMELPINSRSIRIINNKTIILICDSEYNQLANSMYIRIISHIDERHPNSSPNESNFVKRNFVLQQRIDFSSCNCTMVTGPAMVYMLNESVKQVPYPWIVKPMPNQNDYA
ncbi:MAG: hypothetical protein EZS28_000353 [Streblomastix strix]|uniref:Uncharacterized protein n=1 Tax=Streblomastix strix TaxID=222440 RepID=A0A5J4XC50_9EUKA|nr:MAG: hypothetical protein EZS28_000353 [Streblomastix strix]